MDFIVITFFFDVRIFISLIAISYKFLIIILFLIVNDFLSKSLNDEILSESPSKKHKSSKEIRKNK
jgi:hypothetical protein